ncbi:MAG TPA: NAD(P)-binding domain-containing protein, partial [Burkholderiales bacterium]|nr:NAD(P)-binding domain-containing protein [Burkholderiales bacterium]
MGRAGVIGAGLMGTACTRRLREAGFEVLAYDVDKAKLEAIAQIGAQPRGAVAGVVRDCKTLIIAVFDTDQVERVIEGADGVLHTAARAGEERVVICVSTCDPDRLSALAE